MQEPDIIKDFRTFLLLLKVFKIIFTLKSMFHCVEIVTKISLNHSSWNIETIISYRLRDLSLQDKTEIGGLRKQNEEHVQKLKSLTKESDTLKSENTLLLAQINDLKDQVSRFLPSKKTLIKTQISYYYPDYY